MLLKGLFIALEWIKKAIETDNNETANDLMGVLL
jgi:hypothetical protein